MKVEELKDNMYDLSFNPLNQVYVFNQYDFAGHNYSYGELVLIP